MDKQGHLCQLRFGRKDRTGQAKQEAALVAGPWPPLLLSLKASGKQTRVEDQNSPLAHAPFPSSSCARSDPGEHEVIAIVNRATSTDSKVFCLPVCRRCCSISTGGGVGSTASIPTKSRSICSRWPRSKTRSLPYELLRSRLPCIRYASTLP